MITIYHNPRCSKSREGVQVLEASKNDFEIIKYLDDSFTEETLHDVLNKLQMKPSDLLRKQEKIWKENYKGKNLSEEKILQIMLKEPKLIERPIVVNGSKAVVGRPPERIIEIL